jgi:toxin YoeB
MRVLWASTAQDQYVGWRQSEGGITRKINDLISDVRRDPFRGLGKPEPLKGPLQGWWSRRITDEHRLVYRVLGTLIEKRSKLRNVDSTITVVSSAGTRLM